MGIDKKLDLRNLDFGQAISFLQIGKKVARAGWNGKGMFLVLAGGYKVPLDKLRDGTHLTKEFLQSEGCEEFEILPHIDMWTRNSSGRKAYLVGWLASQSDILSDDWYVVA